MVDFSTICQRHYILTKHHDKSRNLQLIEYRFGQLPKLPTRSKNFKIVSSTDDDPTHQGWVQDRKLDLNVVIVTLAGGVVFAKCEDLYDLICLTSLPW